MDKQYITAGEFAKLASTTKRTIIWYDEMDILRPNRVDAKGYRYYLPEQILDFQAILLLRKLGFSLEEIKEYLSEGKGIKSLFKVKKQEIQEEIEKLQNSLKDLDSYYTNLDANGLLIKPEVKQVNSFDIFYIEKEGSYYNIKDYDEELYSYFSKIPKGSIFLTLFLEEGYRPVKSKMKIAVVAHEGMTIKDEFIEKVKSEKVPTYMALSYIHNGSGSLLSLLWKEVEKYAKKNNYMENKNLPFVDIEYYYSKGLNTEFEINLPIV